MKNMKIVLFGGTTEGRQMSLELARMGAEVTVSVVSEYGAKQLGDHEGVNLRTGPLSSDEMVCLIRGADLVIDATHPFAVEASANIAEASEKACINSFRLVREAEDGIEKNDTTGLTVRVGNREEAADLADGSGNILLTTGVRDLPFYCRRLGTSGLYARVLPTKESIEVCERSGMEASNIIAMQGPFSRQMNEALIREFQIDVLITKESGNVGGFTEKLEACRSYGIKAIVISRPDEKGMTYDEVLDSCRRLNEEKDVRMEG